MCITKERINKGDSDVQQEINKTKKIGENYKIIYTIYLYYFNRGVKNGTAFKE